MCGKNEATTGEHIFKHTVLKELYENVTFDKGDRLLSISQKEHNGRVVESREIIQSTDADKFKFLKSLCASCNGAKSREWDDEFDLFIEYLFRNWHKSLSIGYVNLALIHNNYKRSNSRNLYNYFCKLFGCLLFSKDFPVPKEIISAVNGLNYSNSLGVNAVYDLALKGVNDFGNFLVSHDLMGDHLEGAERSISENCRWAIGFGPLKLAFWYRTPPVFVIGNPWYGKSNRICFTSHA
jgi:hypothetical protein